MDAELGTLNCGHCAVDSMPGAGAEKPIARSSWWSWRGGSVVSGPARTGLSRVSDPHIDTGRIDTGHLDAGQVGPGEIDTGQISDEHVAGTRGITLNPPGQWR